jgi:uncharacterized protein (TIGR03437 family)
MALAWDGSVVAAVSPPAGGNTTSILRLSLANPAPISLNGVWNAFSGDPSAVVGGGLYSLAFSGFQPAATDLGLMPTANLPEQLNGVQVLFDGTPGAILSTAPGRIVAVAPPVLPIGSDTRTGGLYNGAPEKFVSVQVMYNGIASNPVWMPISTIGPGLLTSQYPDLMKAQSTGADARALNADGTVNSASNPAAAGTTITLFATGVGEVTPEEAAGVVASSAPVAPVTKFYSLWDANPFSPTSLQISSIPGTIASVLQVQAPIPSNIQNLPGANLGNGVRQVEFALLLFVPVSSLPQPVSNIVEIYVK